MTTSADAQRRLLRLSLAALRPEACGGSPKTPLFSCHPVKLVPQDAELVTIRAEIVEAIKNPPKP